MNIYTFSNNIYNGNFKKDFFKFSLKKNKKLFKYIFIHILLKLLLVLRLINKNFYTEKYYEYLKHIDVNNISKEFWKKNNHKVDKIKLSKKTIIIDDAPSIIFKPLKLKITTNTDKYLHIDNILSDKITKNSVLYLDKYNHHFKNNKQYIKLNNKYYEFNTKYIFTLLLRYLKIVIILGILSSIISLISLYFATGDFGHAMFKVYLKTTTLLFLNTLPIFILMTLLYLTINSISISFIITSLLSIVLTFINYFKIMFRNDPFVLLDITLISEAKEMMNTYTLNFPIMFYIAVISLIIIAIILIRFFKIKIEYKFIRVVSILLIVMFSIFIYNKLYINDTFYENLVNSELINKNSTTQKYINRGFIYPFINSTNERLVTKPDNYSEEKVKEILSNYEYQNIDENKKVHIVSVMLESFADISKNTDIEFTTDVYGKWHNIEKKSISGTLISPVFGGGTIIPERKFLTGYSLEAYPRMETYSHVRYFNEQGYITTGFHPGYSWFYNRKNVNEYLGFDNYNFWADLDRTEETDEYMWSGVTNDKYVFKDIYKKLNEAKENNKYMFNFSVTYQNHGPQWHTYDENSHIVKKDTYDKWGYQAINYYLDGIYDTINEIDNFINVLEKESEPVVLIMFGDHRPDLGQDKMGYNTAQINIDLTTEEGLLNYYGTPYIIWANSSAKKVLNNDFVGNGKTISANFLMNLFFKEAGYIGNEYMQYSSELLDNVSVIHSTTYMENDVFTTELSKDSLNKYNDFKFLEYYYYTKKYEN